MDRVANERLEAVHYSRQDVLVFLAAGLGGAGLYFFQLYINAPQWVKTTTLVSVLVVYALVVAKTPRLRVRLDQAGDNAYYLGLLFTLMSMAVALYQFGEALHAGDDKSGTAAILSNFGIALFTTIAGILIRVVLHQMRVDPADVESMTRIELSEASKRVKANLDVVSTQVAQFHDELRQRTSDAVQSLIDLTSKDLSEFASQVTAASSTLVEELKKSQTTVLDQAEASSNTMMAFTDSAEQAIGRLRAVEPPPLKLATRLERVTESLEGFADQLRIANDRISEAGSVTSGSTKEVAEAISAAIEGIRRVQNATVENHGDVLKRMEATIVAFDKAAVGFAKSVEMDASAIRELEASNRRYAEAVREAELASDAVMRALTDAARGLTSAIQSAP